MWRAEGLQQASACLREARQVVVFTGAGASAQSGIPTFRDDDGLWREFPPEEFARWQGLLRIALLRPRRLAQFIHAVLHPIAEAAPNAGHVAVAQLEKHVPVTVVTQNIDGLHQEAGSTRVLEVHGSVLEIVTREGRPLRRLSRAELRRIASRVGRAARSRLALVRTLAALGGFAGVGRKGFYRPSVVLFGDAMAEPAWSLAEEACRRCDLLIEVGCSRAVWPAATLPELARRAGARLIAVDPNAASADVWVSGTAAETLPALLRHAFPPGP